MKALSHTQSIEKEDPPPEKSRKRFQSELEELLPMSQIHFLEESLREASRRKKMIKIPKKISLDQLIPEKTGQLHFKLKRKLSAKRIRRYKMSRRLRKLTKLLTKLRRPLTKRLPKDLRLSRKPLKVNKMLLKSRVK